MKENLTHNEKRLIELLAEAGVTKEDTIGILCTLIQSNKDGQMLTAIQQEKKPLTEPRAKMILRDIMMAE